jgi:hypothetical protein
MENRGLPPAFCSSRQAAAFAALLAILIALPALFAGAGLLHRSDVYLAIPWKYGESPWTQQKIFTEKGDVDIALISSSHLWAGVDTPYLQNELSRQLGRPATVFTLGWPWPGFDVTYTVARDLLNQRRVRMLVIDDEDERPHDAPHLLAAYWFRVGDEPNELRNLPGVDDVSLYGSAVLGMPRQLLSLVRRDPVEDPASDRPNYWSVSYRARNFAQQLGSLSVRLGFNYSRNFVEFYPAVRATASDARIYSDATRNSFRFGGPSSGRYQLQFAKKIGQLCKEKGVRLIVLKLPQFEQRKEMTVDAREPWMEIVSGPVDIVGIPPAKLFGAMSDEEIQRLFYDEVHFNQNGQRFFTPLITPALIKLYADSVAPK